MGSLTRSRTDRWLARSLTALLWAIIIGTGAFPARALDPVGFQELSLLFRIGDPPSDILRQVEQRKLTRPLTEAEARVLREQGASETFLQRIADARLLATPDQLRVLEEKAKLREQPVEAPVETPALPPAPAVRTPPVVSSPAPIKDRTGDKTLTIEKLIILKEPLHTPFYLRFKVAAENGQRSATFRPQGRKYVAEGVEPRVEIPIDLELPHLQENEWATITLDLDPREEFIGTTNVAKRHMARIPLTEKRLYGFPFEFDPPRGTFIVSQNYNQEFVYQVYWRFR